MIIFQQMFLLTEAFAHLIIYQKIILISKVFKNMKKQLPFIEDALNYQQFSRIAQQWVQQRCSKKIAQIHRSFKFKYSVKDLIKIPLPLLSNLIFYTCIKQFYWIFQSHLEKAQKWCIQTSLAIKQAYHQIMMEGNIESKKAMLISKKKNTETVNIKNDFRFQHFILFAVKLITLFLSENFQEIKTQFILESQIYITLIYLIIGVDQGPRSYQVLRNKFIVEDDRRGSLQLRKIQFDEPCSHLKSSSLYQRQTKRLITSKSGRKLKRKPRIRQSIVKFAQPQTDFQTQLKRNLHVPPLLPTVKKKIKAIELYSTYQSSSDKQNKHGIEYLQQRYKKKRMRTNQISNSFDLQLSSTGSPINYTKGFPMSWKPQQLSTLYQNRFNSKLVRRQSLDSSNLNMPHNFRKIQKAQSILRSKKVEHQQWKQIIHQIKKKSFEYNNYSFSRDKENRRKLKKQLRRGFTLYSQSDQLNTAEQHGKLQNCSYYSKESILKVDNSKLPSKNNIKDHQLAEQKVFYSIQQPWRYEESFVPKKHQVRNLKLKELKDAMTGFERQSNFRDLASKASIFIVQQKIPIEFGKV